MGLSSGIKSIDAKKMGLHELTDDELTSLKRKLLEMTSFIKMVCDNEGINWCLCGGSALGAIRHMGFIPWDDDIDIHMTRKDFELFKKVFSKYESKYELLTPGDKDYYYHFPRIFDTTTKLTNIQSLGRGDGVFIDIFIIEDMYDKGITNMFHGIQCTWYLFVISCVATHLRRNLYMKYGDEQLIRKVKVRDAFAFLFRYRALETWIKKADQVFSRVNNPTSKTVVVPSAVKHYFGEIYKREDMCNYMMMPFEDREFPVYAGVHNIMKQRYGDSYMQLPPEDKRERHTCIDIDLGNEN